MDERLRKRLDLKAEKFNILSEEDTSKLTKSDINYKLIKFATTIPMLSMPAFSLILINQFSFDFRVLIILLFGFVFALIPIIFFEKFISKLFTDLPPGKPGGFLTQQLRLILGSMKFLATVTPLVS